MKQTLIFLLFALAACKFSHDKSSGDSEKLLANSYATGFKIYELTTGYKVVLGHPNDHSLKHQTFFIQTTKGESPADAEFTLSPPLNNVAALSVTHIGMLDALNEAHIVKGVCDPFRIYNQTVGEGIKKGLVQNLGESMMPDKEKMLKLNPEVIFMSGFPNATESNQLLKNAGIPIVYTVAWTEKTPLARAEWIKLFGLLSNKWQMADSIFRAVESNYLKMSKLAQHRQEKPKVFAGNSFKGVWYLPGGSSYIATLINDAGGDYIFKSDSATGSLTVSFEVVYKEARNADIWLNVQEQTIAQMLQNDSRYGSFKPVQQKMVFNRQGRGALNAGNDYYETGSWRPDLVLKDLITIFYKADSLELLSYYKKLSE